MHTYKLNPPPLPATVPTSFFRSDGVSVNLRSGHRFIEEFLTDWQAGAEVLDPEGNPLPYSPEAAAVLGLTQG